VIKSVPRVSIGLTVYNSERYVEEAIKSLLGQTFDDFELIISDNGSEDRTEEIALSFSADDRRVRYVRNRVNVGVAGNFNQVFRLSTGEFFKWAAYDDLCAEDFLQSCVEALDRDPGVVLAYPRTAQIDEQGKITSPSRPGPDLTSANAADRFARMMRSPFWATSLFGVVRASVMAETRLLTSNGASDHLLLSEIALRGRFHEVPSEGFFQRDHVARRPHQSSFVASAQFNDPNVRANATFLRLRLIGEYISAINRAPLESYDRIRCYAAVGQWLGSRLVARTARRAMNGS
jgi:glycosyltransferase involved in cell wall biosynthesis